LALVVVVLAACADRPPTKSCIADELPPLRAKWQLRANCIADDRPWCYAACTAGDGDACFDVAIARQSAGEPAGDLFERACRLGVAPGCTNYGAEAWAGNVQLSSRCTFEMFERSCEANEVFGCGMIGRMLVEHHDPFLQLSGMARLVGACHRFSGPPCRFLAYYIEKGMLGPPDRSLIKTLMVDACEGGDRGACGEHGTVDETFDKE
jgi:hypothetical protein